jgi:hypothetical protein
LTRRRRVDDPELLDTPAYKKFLEVRRERIATRLNVFITG